MRLSNPYYCYIEAFLNTFLIAFLKFSLILIKANSLYPMLIDLISHIPQLPFDTIINKYYYHISKHFILALVLIIISYLIFIKKNDLGILC